MVESVALVLSCEHAGREIPPEWADRFRSAEARTLLESHRGWDAGALEVAETMAATGGAPLLAQRVSRLVIDCNRSLGHPSLFSEFTRGLPERERQMAVERIWRPHHDAVRGRIEALAGQAPQRRVVHLGIHSFTPIWRGRIRPTDIGILYDPRRGTERTVAHEWRRGIRRALASAGGLGRAPRLHLNLPYRGWTDSMVTAFRARFGADRYFGLELEVNQRHMPLSPDTAGVLWRTLWEAVERTLPPEPEPPGVPGTGHRRAAKRL